MSNLFENEFNLYLNNLQNKLIDDGSQVRFVLNGMEHNTVAAEEYVAIVLERASKILLDSFDEDDDVFVYIEAVDADLKENYNEVLEEDIKTFYSQFIKNDEVETHTKTFSVYIDEDGKDAVTDYVHVDLKDEDGKQIYVEVIVNHIMKGKFNDISLPGLLAGKCNMLEGYNDEDELDDKFIIRDKVMIINKTKDLVYSLYNDILLDVMALDENVIDTIAKKHKQLVIA